MRRIIVFFWVIIGLSTVSKGQISGFSSDFTRVPVSANHLSLGNIPMLLNGNSFDIFSNPALVSNTYRKIGSCQVLTFREIDLRYFSANLWMNNYGTDVSSSPVTFFNSAARIPFWGSKHHDLSFNCGIKGYLPTEYDNTQEWRDRFEDVDYYQQKRVVNSELMFSFGLSGSYLKDFCSADFLNLDENDTVPLSLKERITLGASIDVVYRKLAITSDLGVYPNFGFTYRFGDYLDLNHATVIGFSYCHLDNLIPNSGYYNLPAKLRGTIKMPFVLKDPSKYFTLYSGFDKIMHGEVPIVFSG